MSTCDKMSHKFVVHHQEDTFLSTSNQITLLINSDLLLYYNALQIFILLLLRLGICITVYVGGLTVREQSLAVTNKNTQRHLTLYNTTDVSSHNTALLSQSPSFSTEAQASTPQQRSKCSTDAEQSSRAATDPSTKRAQMTR